MDALRIVSEASGPAIATDAENRILRVNRAARELLGYTGRRAHGENLNELLHARDTFGNRLSGQQYGFSEMVSRSEPVHGFGIEVRKASGDSLRLAVSVIVVLESDGQDYQLVYHLRPIYRRRKADEAIDRILALRGTADEDLLRLRSAGSEKSLPKLTRRQIEVLRLMALGATVAEMATSLGISVNTVRTHIQQILRRLEARSQLEAVAVAFRLRLL